MKITDDRTDAQKKTHAVAIVGTDRVLSNWFGNGLPSYAAWAFEEGRESEVRSRIAARSDMQRVRQVVLDGYRPRGPGDLHIYVYES